MNNYSKQREAILEVIKDSYTHLSAEEIYERVHQIDSQISKSTVYRNIKLLVENKNIIEIAKANGPNMFDYIHKPHSHIICTKCGEVFDFEYDFDEIGIIKKVEEQTGVETDMEKILIYGICQQCKSKI